MYTRGKNLSERKNTNTKSFVLFGFDCFSFLSRGWLMTIAKFFPAKVPVLCIRTITISHNTDLDTTNSKSSSCENKEERK